MAAEQLAQQVEPDHGGHQEDQHHQCDEDRLHAAEPTPRPGRRPTYDALVQVVAIRRYPVKAMVGEDLQTADLIDRGLAGDRWFAVVDGEGRLACARDSRRFRRHDEVLDYAAATHGDRVRVSHGQDEWWVGDPALDDHLSQTLQTRVSVKPEGATSHMDDSPVSVIGTASLRWCAERYGGRPDARRLRANVVVETEEPFVEESWTGRELTLGGAVLRITTPTVRCRTIDVAQDGLSGLSPWLRHLGERDLELAVYADVVRPGTIRLGDRALPTE